jgi:TolB-like protein/Tfp pilus assembly protein PilF
LPKKARALLAYLAMQKGRSIPREHLAVLLWGDSRDEQARRSLRECLMVVRAALGAEVLASKTSTVRLDPDRVEIDVQRFEELSRSTKLGDLRAAGELYREEFLFSIQISSEPFAEWLAFERQRLASVVSDVVYRLAAALAQGGETNDAIGAARRLIALDPMREDGHRFLIRLLAAAGQRGAALKQYADCADLLRNELGVTPERDTVELAKAVRQGFIHAEALSNGRTRAIPLRTQAGVFTRMPNKTSVAVIPFSNLSGQLNDDYFADGIAEELATMLGRVPWLFVIGSGGAAGPYRGGATDIRQIGDNLGVRYVLRGSVRKNADRVRIVAQLLDAAKGGQVWAERFDGKLNDIFALQDQLAAQACAKIAPALQSIEIERSQRKPTESLNAYDLYLRALPRFRTTFAENQEAVRMLKKAIEIDPQYGSAYGLAARCYQFQRLFGWVIASDPSLQEGVRLAHLAAEIGRDDSEALWMAGMVMAQLAGELEHGLALIERSLALNPNSANAWISSSFVRGEIGDADTAFAHFQQAQRLNPLDSMHHVQWLAAGFAHMVAGRYQEAADAIDKTLNARPSYTPAMRQKISVCGLLGRKEEASHWVRRLLAVNPGASVSWFRVFWQQPLRHNPNLLAKFLEGARLAGLPEGEQMPP